MDHVLFCSSCGAFRPLVYRGSSGEGEDAGDDTTAREDAATGADIDGDAVTCSQCGFTTVSDRKDHVALDRSPLLHRLYNLQAVSASAPASSMTSGSTHVNVPDTLGHGNAQDDRDALDVEDSQAVIDENCPKCDHPQMAFRTAQLRGVDEGQTIFYTCLNKRCRHHFTVNS